MSDFCDSACTEFCAELANVRRIGRHAQNKQSGTEIVQFADFVQQYCSALSSALMAATDGTKYFHVKVIKYSAVLCINAAVTGVTISNCNKFSSYMHLVT